MRPLFALFIGLLFGAGLCLSGMTSPAKVQGFLDISGAWDPSLAFVMAGAIGVGLVFFRLARRRLPAPSHRIDPALVTGSIVFGVGWGLVGYCPGPALTAIAGLDPKALTFAAAMLAGTALQRFVASLRVPSGGLTPVATDDAAAANACGA